MFSRVAPGYCGTHANRLDPSPDGAPDINGFDGWDVLDLAGAVERLYCTTKTANATSTALIITRSIGLVFLGGVAVMPCIHDIDDIDNDIDDRCAPNVEWFSARLKKSYRCRRALPQNHGNIAGLA